MDYRDGLSELGKNIEDIIQSSLDILQAEIGKVQVNSAVEHAIDEVRKGLSQAGDRLDDERYRNRTPKKPLPDVSRMTPSQVLRYSQIPVCKRLPGNASSVLSIVFGAIGLGCAGCGGIAALMAGASPVAVIMMLILAGVGAGAMAIGMSVRKRIGRFIQYLRVINNREYCKLDELLPKAENNPNLLRRDLKAMAANGMFPQAHVDEERTTLMLTDAVWQQYLEVKEQRRLAEEEREENEKREAENPEIAELNKAVSEGEHFISLIRQANDEILGEAISEKLSRLENVTQKIFGHIKRHPSQLKDIRRFMGYYLPTATKLAYVYCELDKQPVSGENIASAKADIEKSLDMVNQAFENLLDDLFAHTALDVSSDVTVLEAMLAQEGLTGKK